MKNKFVVFPLRRIGRRQEVNLDLFATFDNHCDAEMAKQYINKLDMECIVITSANFSCFDDWKQIVESNLKTAMLDSILVEDD